MKNTINIVVGDWSRDGHGHTETMSIKSNFTNIQIEKAFKEGCKIIGFDFGSNVAAEYQSSELDLEESHKIFNQINMQEAQEIADKFETNTTFSSSEVVNLDVGSYTALWLMFVKLSSPEFEFEIVEQQKLYIDGYGLFYE